MYENMTVLTNKEYAELIIKANKYDEMDKPDYKELVRKAQVYDELREEALYSRYTTSSEKRRFNITAEEYEAHAGREE